MSVTTMEHLRASRFFSTLGDAALTGLEATARRIEMETGRLLFTRGDVADAFYIILSGVVAIEMLSPEGRVMRVATLEAGSIFGELAVLDGGMRTADARIHENAAVIRLPAGVIADLLRNEPEFAATVIRDLVAKLRATNDQVESIASMPLRLRLARMLINLGVDQDGRSRIIEMTQSELAERLIATREKVNMHLHTLQRAGAVALSRGKIEIRDLAVLQELGDIG